MAVSSTELSASPARSQARWSSPGVLSTSSDAPSLRSSASSRGNRFPVDPAAARTRTPWGVSDALRAYDSSRRIWAGTRALSPIAVMRYLRTARSSTGCTTAPSRAAACESRSRQSDGTGRPPHGRKSSRRRAIDVARAASPGAGSPGRGVTTARWPGSFGHGSRSTAQAQPRPAKAIRRWCRAAPLVSVCHRPAGSSAVRQRAGSAYRWSARYPMRQCQNGASEAPGARRAAATAASTAAGLGTREFAGESGSEFGIVASRSGWGSASGRCLAPWCAPALARDRVQGSSIRRDLVQERARSAHTGRGAPVRDRGPIRPLGGTGGRPRERGR